MARTLLIGHSSRVQREPGEVGTGAKTGFAADSYFRQNRKTFVNQWDRKERAVIDAALYMLTGSCPLSGSPPLRPPAPTQK